MDLRIQIRIEETFAGNDVAAIFRQPFCDDISVGLNRTVEIGINNTNQNQYSIQDLLISNGLQTLYFANYSKNMNYKKIVVQGRHASVSPPTLTTKNTK